MNLLELRGIIDDISLPPDWGFNAYSEADSHSLQIRYFAPDAGGGELSVQAGRKWRISRYMTRSEVVQTALLAYLTAVEHEAREHFRYKGQAIFSPHLNAEALVIFTMQHDSLDTR